MKFRPLAFNYHLEATDRLWDWGAQQPAVWIRPPARGDMPSSSDSDNGDNDDENGRTIRWSTTTSDDAEVPAPSINKESGSPVEHPNQPVQMPSPLHTYHWSLDADDDEEQMNEETIIVPPTTLARYRTDEDQSKDKHSSKNAAEAQVCDNGEGAVPPVFAVATATTTTTTPARYGAIDENENKDSCMKVGRHHSPDHHDEGSALQLHAATANTPEASLEAMDFAPTITTTAVPVVTDKKSSRKRTRRQDEGEDFTSSPNISRHISPLLAEKHQTPTPEGDQTAPKNFDKEGNTFDYEEMAETKATPKFPDVYVANNPAKIMASATEKPMGPITELCDVVEDALIKQDATKDNESDRFSRNSATNDDAFLNNPKTTENAAPPRKKRRKGEEIVAAPNIELLSIYSVQTGGVLRPICPRWIQRMLRSFKLSQKEIRLDAFQQLGITKRTVSLPDHVDHHGQCLLVAKGCFGNWDVGSQESRRHLLEEEEQRLTVPDDTAEGLSNSEERNTTNSTTDVEKSWQAAIMVAMYALQQQEQQKQASAPATTSPKDDQLSPLPRLLVESKAPKETEGRDEDPLESCRKRKRDADSQHDLLELEGDEMQRPLESCTTQATEQTESSNKTPRVAIGCRELSLAPASNCRFSESNRENQGSEHYTFSQSSPQYDKVEIGTARSSYFAESKASIMECQGFLTDVEHSSASRLSPDWETTEESQNAPLPTQLADAKDEYSQFVHVDTFGKDRIESYGGEKKRKRTVDNDVQKHNGDGRYDHSVERNVAHRGVVVGWDVTETPPKEDDLNSTYDVSRSLETSTASATRKSNQILQSRTSEGCFIESDELHSNPSLMTTSGQDTSAKNNVHSRGKQTTIIDPAKASDLETGLFEPLLTVDRERADDRVHIQDSKSPGEDETEKRRRREEKKRKKREKKREKRKKREKKRRKSSMTTFVKVEGDDDEIVCLGVRAPAPPDSTISHSSKAREENPTPSVPRDPAQENQLAVAEMERTHAAGTSKTDGRSGVLANGNNPSHREDRRESRQENRQLATTVGPKMDGSTVSCRHSPVRQLIQAAREDATFAPTDTITLRVEQGFKQNSAPGSRFDEIGDKFTRDSEESIVASPQNKFSNLPSLQLFCAESFLERWGDVVVELSSGQWPHSVIRDVNKTISNPIPDSAVLGRKITFLDSSLIDICEVDVELPGAHGLIVQSLHMWGEDGEERKAFIKKILQTASKQRYHFLHCFFIVEGEMTKSQAIQLQRLQNVFAGNECPTRVHMHVSSLTALSCCLAKTILRVVSSNDTEKYKKVLRRLSDEAVAMRAAFLVKLLPTMNAVDALHSITFSRIHNPIDQFQLLLRSEMERQKLCTVMKLADRPKINPKTMSQLSHVLRACLKTVENP